MSVLPPTTIEQIQFYEAHNPVWSATPTAIGLTAAQMTALTSATTNARKAYNDAQSARQASKTATTSLHTDAAIMRGQVADLIRQIKAFAELQGNPGTVYAAAQIPAPAAPTPAPAPASPAISMSRCSPTGPSRFRGTRPSRPRAAARSSPSPASSPGQSGFAGIGGAPGSTSESRRASFTDSTIPASAANDGAQYIVQGFRGTRVGIPSDAITVQFGVEGGGGGGLSVSGDSSLALAA